MKSIEMKWSRRFVRTAVIVLSLAGLVLSAQLAAAADVSITLGPGETTRIPMKFWCLDFGKPFPTAVSGPGSRAPDAVVKVLDTALANGMLTSNPYQTQLAIWKAADGNFHDTGTEGHVAAEQIISASATANVPAVAGAAALDQLVSQGTLKVTVENFKAITDTTRNNQQPYMGTGELVVQNPTSQKVSFVLVEGAVFKPAAGANAQTTTGTTEQTLISHQDTQKTPTSLPTTGSTTSSVALLSIVAILLGALGLFTGARLLNAHAAQR